MRRRRPRFIVDAMLGSLARWLRLLGYDALYFRDLEDADLVERALRERRLLLTRDQGLARRRNARGRVVLLRARRLPSQWTELARICGLRPSAALALSRCGDCNEPLRPLSRARARARVPAYVHATRRRFRRCLQCGRIFWRATHLGGISSRLAGMRAAVRSAPARCAPGDASRRLLSVPSRKSG